MQSVKVSPRSRHDPSVVGLVGEAAVLDEAVAVPVPLQRAAQQRGAGGVHVAHVGGRQPRAAPRAPRLATPRGRRRLQGAPPARAVQQLQDAGHRLRTRLLGEPHHNYHLYLK